MSYDAWKLASDPEYGEEPTEDDRAWCDWCEEETDHVRHWHGRLLCETCIAIGEVT